MRRFEDQHKISKQQLSIDYKKLGSLRAVAEKYSTSHDVVKKMMDRFGLVYSRENYKRLSLNQEFFSTVDSKSMYWVGFLAADGCVHKNYLRLTLAEKDIDHLRLFKNDIGFGGKIGTTVSGVSTCNTVAVCSKRIVRDLEYFGVVPNKTKKLKFPQIDKNMIRHFCRGYFDGDGCWSLHKPKSRPGHRPQLVFSTRGTEDFLLRFNECLVRYAGLPDRCLSKSLKGWGTSVLQFNGNNICVKIAKWMYGDLSDKDRFLKRKREFINGIVQEVLGHTHSIVLP